MTLAQLMKERQSEIRRTSTECAVLAGMTPSEWSRWAAGQSRRKDGKPSEPRRETLSAIAFALDMTPTEIMEKIGYSDPACDVPSELVSAWNRVPTDKRPQFLRAVREIAGVF